jgi:two-component system, LytTR family, response regulator
MISCIIIDDEKKARETFEKIIERYLPDRVKIVYSAVSVKDGVFAIHKYNPELVFLDIEMPEENGFKLFEYFEKITFGVVFLTAYKNYAIDAIRYAALDYLLKPLDYIDLLDVISRYEKKMKENTFTDRIRVLMSNLNSGADIQAKIALPTLKGYVMEKINNIVYCEADENYTKIFTVSGQPIIVSKTMKVVEELLPPEYFFRIHKSYIVNLNYVRSYDRSEGHRITLENGTVLDVATRRTDEFLKVLTRKKL